MRRAVAGVLVAAGVACGTSAAAQEPMTNARASFCMQALNAGLTAVIDVLETDPDNAVAIRNGERFTAGMALARDQIVASEGRERLAVSARQTRSNAAGKRLGTLTGDQIFEEILRCEAELGAIVP
jgi:hypothetical protein